MIYHLTPRHTKEKNDQVISKLLTDIGNLKDKDIKIEIKDYDFRSLNALKAYFVLIDVVVDWHKQYCLDHGGKPYGVREWRYYFEDQAGLVDEIDLMPMWELQVKPHKVHFADYTYYAAIPFYKEFGGNFDRYKKQPRSLSNKGDVTKQELERLLNTILQFGAENGIEDCKIEDREFKRMLRAYD